MTDQTVRWFPAMGQTERVDLSVAAFTEKFQAANPPPEKGHTPVSLEVLKPKDEARPKGSDERLKGAESNRWPLVGGPYDGEGIAKTIEIKKGAGKKKITTSFAPASVIAVSNEEGSIKGLYKFADQVYTWEDLSTEPNKSRYILGEWPPDPWADPEYWSRNNERQSHLQGDV